MSEVAEALLTAEEFADLPDDGTRRELVRGRVVATSLPGFDHACIQGQLACLIDPYLKRTTRGRLVCRVGAVLARNPDTVRGPDVAYYSFARLPATSRPRGYPNVLPELVFEIRSPSDRWADVMAKVAEYLAADIIVVAVDPVPQRVHVFEPNQPPRQLGVGDIFELLALWPGLSFPVLDIFA